MEFQATCFGPKRRSMFMPPQGGAPTVDQLFWELINESRRQFYPSFCGTLPVISHRNSSAFVK